MKRAYASIALLLCATACTTLVYVARYDIGLSAVERQQAGVDIKRFTDVNGHTFEDEFIKVRWTPFDTQLGLILTNKTDSSQRVVWDETAYVSPDGSGDQVVHESDVADRVDPGATLLDLIEPAGHARGSHHAPLIGYTRGTSEREVRSKMVRGTIRVLLPIDMNGTIRRYSFAFSVKGSPVVAGWSS